MQISSTSKLLEEIARKQHRPFYMVVGEDPFRSYQTIFTITSALEKQGVFEERCAFTIETKEDWEQLITCIQQHSLFGSRRLFMLTLTKNFNAFGRQQMVTFLEGAIHQEVVLLTLPQIDKKEESTPWWKLASEHGGVRLNILRLSHQGVMQWIQEHGKSYGKKFSREACMFLAEQIDGNLYRAHHSIELCCMAFDDKIIELSMVESALGGGRTGDVFQMLRAALVGNLSTSITLLDRIEHIGIKPVSIVGAIHWEVNRILTVAEALDDGESLSNIYQRLSIWTKQGNAISACITRHSIAALLAIQCLIFDLDFLAKRSQNRLFWLLLRDLILQIVGVKPVQSLKTVTHDSA